MGDENEIMSSGVKDALDAGALLAGVMIPIDSGDGRVPFLAVPEGYDVKSVEHFLPPPSR